MNHARPPKSLPALARALAGAALLMVFGAIGASPLHAEARVSGKANMMRLEARNASISEVLTALGAAYEMPSGSNVLLSKTITGTYAGSVREIVSQVLGGYDYVVKGAPGKLSIVIYGSSKTPPNISTAKAGSEPQNTQPAAKEDSTGTKPPGAAHAVASSMVTGNADDRHAGDADDRHLTNIAASPYNNITGLPEPPVTSGGVTLMLEAAASSQMQTGMQTGMAASAPPSGPANMAALTQSATASLRSLVSALNNVPHL
jgi:hypothetical protein